MKRNEFKFGYYGKDVAVACEKKVAYHEERLAWWRVESELAEANLKDATIEFREFEATGGKQIQPVIDPTLQGRYNECQQKIRSHEQEVENYDRWRRGFEANAGTTFQLDPDDIAYFGL